MALWVPFCDQPKISMENCESGVKGGNKTNRAFQVSAFGPIPGFPGFQVNLGPTYHLFSSKSWKGKGTTMYAVLGSIPGHSIVCWVESVAGSRPCSESFSAGYMGFTHSFSKLN